MEEVIEKESEILRKLLITNESLCKSSVDFGYDSNKLKLPDGWSMMKIKDFSKVQAGSTPLRSNKDFFNDGIHHWVKTLDLNNDRIISSEEKITDLALAKTSCKLREAGTILVAMYGGFNQIGRTGLLEIEAATNQAISAVMMDKNIVLPEYLLLVLNTKIDYWKKVAISSRKDPNITKVDVENFPVPVPSLAIQKSILLNTNSILRSAGDIDTKSSSSKALQKSLINQIF
jgi:type I restriction enzyme S subunit